MSARTILLSGALVASAFATGASADVFNNASSQAVWSGELDNAQIRMRMVEFDATEILNSRSGEVTLDLFNDATFVATTDLLELGEGDDFSWRGRGADGASHAVLTRRDGETAAIIRDGQRIFELIPSGNGVSRLVEVHAEALAPCGVDDHELLGNPLVGGEQNLDDLYERTAAAQNETSSAARGALNPTLDQLVAYTPNALEWVGGTTSGMSAFIDNAILDMNTVLANNSISMETRVVFKHALETNETGNGPGDRNAFRINGDGIWDEIHQLREDFGADMCHILVRNSNVCGIAAMIYRRESNGADFAFCLTAMGCVSNSTFTHEVGHLIGCAHDIQNAGGIGGAGTFSYSFGWRDPDDATWRTIMAYAPGARVPYFSSPNSSHSDGEPYGDVVLANNAETIELNIPFITGWRGSVGLAPTNVAADANPGGITISWDPVAQAANYQIWRANINDPLASQLRGLSDTTSWTDDNVNGGQTYYYFTKSRFADGGVSPFSEGVEATASDVNGADLSGDGVVDSVDLAILLAAWGTPGGDLSGDGNTDATDIAVLLAAWG